MKTQEDFILEQASNLASACARDEVKDYQLGQILAHLKRHRNVAKTRKLLGILPRSRFVTRGRDARTQYLALEANVTSALTGVTDWQRAAEIVAWSKRLLKAPRETHGADRQDY